MLKTKSIILFISIILMSFSVDMKTEVEKQINEKFGKVEGNFALAFKLVGSEDNSILINEKEMFHAASTMKTPVMIEAFKQDANGIIDLQDSLIVKNSFKSIVDGSEFSLDINRDSGDKAYEMIGKKDTYYNLVYDMIIHSSNLATNIVIEQLSAQNVMKTMDELGAKTIKVLRGVEDMKAFDAGLNNETSANDLMILFEKIAEGKAVNPKADSIMIEILLNQKHNSIIPAKLPSEVKVAHKTGSITGVLHDSGIVILPDGRKYVLVILSKNITSAPQTAEMMSEVSKIIYDYVNNL
ncbi:MAG: class A beta-lactamase-related serine hydrolase [Bacteroidetes bacterium]|nr:class A beta-lactamase-related serine hydrolase [Bacteroidota bacterium]MBU1114511.1 class A beta-lactamase-related serine hydrolase [Bacteroidota bacterium]MBU1799695.1 class A beta-lactamase-related serine hydrolase [Bacteroidota bacterium]